MLRNISFESLLVKKNWPLHLKSASAGPETTLNNMLKKPKKTYYKNEFLFYIKENVEENDFAGQQSINLTFKCIPKIT